MNIVKPTMHRERWGAQLPNRLVSEAEEALRHYPSWLELKDAADDQRSMHIWMVRETEDTPQQDEAVGRLVAVAERIGAEMSSEGVSLDHMGYLHAWLETEHPAVGYRLPIELLFTTGNPERIVELFEAEHSIAREAKRVFKTEGDASRWLRSNDRSLGGIPLEMLGSEAGRLKITDELRRCAAAKGTRMARVAKLAKAAQNDSRTS
ncbi:antitoxin Xre/MbcA/ParS toxin-binding domain-containing protein [Variovorax sp. GT1P44]|uniref:antitoxin Xre/MbcA/ParS toxin-binding domain-containing protein n=1 Tax=Variovorax sp. GT1P44 TaxID=3443742 RepID=UPI003F44EB63